MNRFFMTIMAAALTGACAFQMQAADPLSSEAKQAYNRIKTNLLKMAEKMSEADYSFKATPEVKTFGQNVAHVADAQMGTCSAVNGEMNRARENPALYVTYVEELRSRNARRREFGSGVALGRRQMPGGIDDGDIRRVQTLGQPLCRYDVRRLHFSIFLMLREREI